MMIYLPNVFLLKAIKQLHSCVFGESIIEGYSLKSFRKNVAFFTHHQDMDDELGFFGENIITIFLYLLEKYGQPCTKYRVEDVKRLSFKLISSRISSICKSAAFRCAQSWS